MSKFLNFIFMLIAALFGITLVITVHEMGHFLAAKLFSVKTPVFSIGFGPELFYHYFSTTKFRIAALPIGGYVSIDPVSFDALSYWPKMVIVSAGIIFNIIFAAIVYRIIKNQVACTEIEQDILSSSNSESESESQELGPIQNKIICNAPALVKNLLREQHKDFVGPIGIIKLIGKSATLGVEPYFFFLALISLNIAIFNMLPIPLLDGGQALQITLERIFNGSVPAGVLSLVYIVIALLLYFLFKKKS